MAPYLSFVFFLFYFCHWLIKRIPFFLLLISSTYILPFLLRLLYLVCVCLRFRLCCQNKVVCAALAERFSESGSIRVWYQRLLGKEREEITGPWSTRSQVLHSSVYADTPQTLIKQHSHVTHTAPHTLSGFHKQTEAKCVPLLLPCIHILLKVT